MTTATREQFFKPAKTSAAAKAEETNSVAKGIIAQETAARDKKTEKLRALRLAKEAAPSSRPPPLKPVARYRRGRSSPADPRTPRC